MRTSQGQTGTHFSTADKYGIISRGANNMRKLLSSILISTSLLGAPITALANDVDTVVTIPGQEGAEGTRVSIPGGPIEEKTTQEPERKEPERVGQEGESTELPNESATQTTEYDIAVFVDPSSTSKTYWFSYAEISKVTKNIIPTRLSVAKESNYTPDYRDNNTDRMLYNDSRVEEIRRKNEEYRSQENTTEVTTQLRRPSDPSRIRVFFTKDGWETTKKFWYRLPSGEENYEPSELLGAISESEAMALGYTLHEKNGNTPFTLISDVDKAKTEALRLNSKSTTAQRSNERPVEAKSTPQRAESNTQTKNTLSNLPTTGDTGSTVGLVIGIATSILAGFAGIRKKLNE